MSRPLPTVALVTLRFAELGCQRVCVTNKGICACSGRKRLIAEGAVSPDILVSQEDLTVASFAAVLQQIGVQTTVFDQGMTQDTDAALGSRLAALNPDVIVFTSNFRHESVDQVDRLCAMAAQVRRNLPEAVLFLSAQAASLCAAAVLRAHPALDAVIVGEGEATLREALGALATDRPLVEVAGLLTRVGGYRSFRSRVKMDLSQALPWPQRYMLETLSAEERSRRACVIQGSRGCVYACAFCDAPRLERVSHGDPWRGRPVADVVAEMKHLHSRYGIARFIFTDDLWVGAANALGRRRIREFLDELGRCGLSLRFTVSARIDSFRDPEDRELLEELCDAGLYTLFIGIDSGHEDVLRWYGKGVYDPSAMEDSLSFLRSCGVLPRIGFINFQPFSTEEQLRANVEFLGRIECAHFFRLFASRLHIRSHHRLYESVRRAGLILPSSPWALQRYRFANSRVAAAYARFNVLAETFTPVDHYLDDLEKRLWHGESDDREAAGSLRRAIGEFYRALALELLEGEPAKQRIAEVCSAARAHGQRLEPGRQEESFFSGVDPRSLSSAKVDAAWSGR